MHIFYDYANVCEPELNNVLSILYIDLRYLLDKSTGQHPVERSTDFMIRIFNAVEFVAKCGFPNDIKSLKLQNK